MCFERVPGRPYFLAIGRTGRPPTDIIEGQERAAARRGRPEPERDHTMNRILIAAASVLALSAGAAFAQNAPVDASTLSLQTEGSQPTGTPAYPMQAMNAGMDVTVTSSIASPAPMASGAVRDAQSYWAEQFARGF
jgi:hypothetical protein